MSSTYEERVKAGLVPPGDLVRAENRELRDRVEALEQAIRDADECVREHEGVGIVYFMDWKIDSPSHALLTELLCEDG